MALSTRGRRAIQPALPYWPRFEQGVKNLYDAHTNTEGYVLLAVAENKSGAAIDAALCKLAECRGRADASTLGYDNMAGRTAFRAAFAHMISRTVLGGRIQIAPDHLTISSGCGAVLFQLTMLLCDPGEAILLPTPTYAALYNDMGSTACGHVVDVPAHSPGFLITRCDLEAAAARAEADGHPPRVLLLLNPSNPLGTLYSREELELCLRFVRARGMHLIVDEIYANSVWGDTRHSDGAPSSKPQPFLSMVEFMHNAAAAADSGVDGTSDATSATRISSSSSSSSFMGNDVHVLWGISKDFAMSGMRVGCLYTHSKDLLAALSNVNYFTTVSNDTQDALGAMLGDEAWTNAFLAQNRRTLREAYARVSELLTEAGIPFTRACAGMFAWVDLRAWLPAANDGTRCTR